MCRVCRAGLSVELVDDETGTEFRLEPCCLGRHDVAGIGNSDELSHGDGVKSERHCHLAAVHTPLEFLKSADTSDEVDSLVGTEVGDIEDVAEDKVARYGHVEYSDGIAVVVGSLLCSERIPFAVEI